MESLVTYSRNFFLPFLNCFHILQVSYTAVIQNGVRIAIDHLPNLKSINCDFSLQVVAQMALDEAAPLNRSLSITDLKCVNPVPAVSKVLLAAAFQACPFLVKVQFLQCDALTDQDLQALLNVQHLKHFSITYDGQFSFDGGIRPILEKFGPNSLEELHLGWIDEVNIGDIFQYCINLRSLSLDHIQNYSTSRHQLPRASAPPLLKLQNLSVKIYCSQSWPSDADLSRLLSSPKLANLDLFGNFSDHFLIEAASLHRFRRLQSIDISVNDRVNQESIEFLLNLNTPLPLSIQILRCPLITQENSLALKDIIRSSNLNVKISVI